MSSILLNNVAEPSSRRLRIVGAIGILVLLLAAAPTGSLAASGFDFCASPYQPECVFAQVNGATAGACEREVTAYIRAVFRYRECLETESQRVVRESNDLIDHWRCRQSGERCRR